MTTPGSAAASLYLEQALDCLSLFKGFRRNTVDFGAFSTRILPLRVWRQLDGDQQADCRRVALARLIYEHFYSTPGDRGEPRGADKSQRRHAQSKTLIAALSAANSGSGSSESGWRTELVDDGLAISNGSCLLHLAEPSVDDGHAGAVPPGDARLQLTVPKQFLSRSVGFYLAVGNRNLIQGGAPLIRVYFNCTPEGSVCLMRLITCQLNALDVPFHFKVLTEGPMTRRRDSAVLYFRLENLPQVRQLVEDAAPLLLASTLKGVPPFTLPLLPGIAIAEDPADGQSFGSSRAAILADVLVEHALLPSAQQGPQRFSGLLEAQFAARGASLAAPYLHSAARNPFDGLAIRPPSGKGSTPHGEGVPRRADDRLSQAPAQLANMLCESAIWDKDTCTWLAPTLAEGCWPTLPYEVLGADLNDGASGVALFLARAWQHFGSAEFARCARGAVGYALAAVEDSTDEAATGIRASSNWPGVCMAAGMVGDILGDRALLAKAVETAGAKALDVAPAGGGVGPVEALLGRIAALSQLAGLSHDAVLQSFVQADLQRLAALAPTAADADRDGEGCGLAGGRYGHLRALLAARLVAGSSPALTQRIELERKRAELRHRALRGQADPDIGDTSWYQGVAGYVAVASDLDLAGNSPALARERLRIAHALLTRLQDGPCDLGLRHGLAGQASVLMASRPAGLGAAEDVCDRVVEPVTRAVLDLLMPAGGCSPLGRFTHPSLMQGVSGIGLFLLQRLTARPGPLSVILGIARPCTQFAAGAAKPKAQRPTRDAIARLAS